MRISPVMLLMVAGLLWAGSSAFSQDYSLEVADLETPPGANFAMPIDGEWAENVLGFSLSMAFPPNPPILDLDISVENTLVGAQNPEFVQVNIFLAEGEVVMGVLFELFPPFDGIVLPPLGFPIAIAELTGSIPAGTPDQDIPFDFVDGLGDPPILNVFVVELESVPPDVMTGGLLQVREAQVPVDPIFIRGDVTMDGQINLADVIYHLNYTFAGGPLPLCDDAADANDDGHPDISDGVFVLYYLFVDGPQPWPPFPDPGIDYTPDNLGCANPLEP